MRFPRTTSPQAFTLVELLVVLAVIAVLIGLIVPVLRGIGSGNALTSAGAIVVGELEHARNLALSRTETIELRFIKLPDPVSNEEQYRAIQLYQAAAPQTPLGQLQRLPAGVIAVEGTGVSSAYSTITAPANPTGGDMEIHGETRSYRAVRFLPNGSTALDPLGAGGGADRWFLSLKLFNAPAPASDDRPADNFVTVLVDPVTGRAQAFRP